MRRLLALLLILAGLSPAAAQQTYNFSTPVRLSALSNSVTAVKAVWGQLDLLQCWNPNTSVAYVQLFAAPTTGVTLGTTLPTLSVPIAPTATGGFAMAHFGPFFPTAISAAATTTATGSTAPSTPLDCNAFVN